METNCETKGLRSVVMSLDLNRLEKARLSGDKVISRCPACAEVGADRSCEHLSIEDEGRGAYHCIVDPDGKGGLHSKRIWELAGMPNDRRFVPFLATPKPRTIVPKAEPRLPPLRSLNVAEMAAIANLRVWPSFAGLEFLGRRGLLWYGEVWDDDRSWPAWLITDSTRRNAQARRLDGEPWAGIGHAKAKTLPGCDPSWPIGAAEIGTRPVVVLCEGGPDFLASLFVAWWEGGPGLVNKIAPVCMTGGGNNIQPNALAFFAGKHIRIAVHADDQGREAGERWAGQLYGAGAEALDGFDFSGLVRSDGKPVKDLADFATLLDLERTQTVAVFSDLHLKPAQIPLPRTEAGTP